MATKEQLSDEAQALAKALGKVVVTDELSSRELSALVSDLKAKSRDEKRVTQADDNYQPTPKEERSEVAKKYEVAKGSALCCGKKGMLEEGDDVVGLSDEQLAVFLEKGKIVEKGKAPKVDKKATHIDIPLRKKAEKKKVK